MSQSESSRLSGELKSYQEEVTKLSREKSYTEEISRDASVVKAKLSALKIEMQARVEDGVRRDREHRLASNIHMY